MKIMLQTRAIGIVLLSSLLSIAAANAQYVHDGPPPPVIERPYAAPGHGYRWVPGYQRWDGHRYQWAAGRWVLPPRPAAIWVAGHWDRSPYGWHWVPGHWRG